jgi:hypothetical protein
MFLTVTSSSSDLATSLAKNLPNSLAKSLTNSSANIEIVIFIAYTQ